MKSKWILQHGVGKLHKKSNSTLRAKRATFTNCLDKSPLKMPKMINLTCLWKNWSFGLTVLPDRSTLKGKKLAGNAKNESFKWGILKDFHSFLYFKKQ